MLDRRSAVDAVWQPKTVTIQLRRLVWRVTNAWMDFGVGLEFDWEVIPSGELGGAEVIVLFALVLGLRVLDLYLLTYLLEVGA